MKFENKVSVITGAGQGIGEAIAAKLSSHGCKIAILDSNIDKAEKVADTLTGLGGDVSFFKTDITKSYDVSRSISCVIDAFNNIDILINNAGWTEAHSFIDESEEYWNKIIDVNLKGAILVTSIVIPYMIKNNTGKIVNVASEAGRIGNIGEVVYSAAKGGLIAFTKSLAREMARYKINVNCISPGPTNTPLMKYQPKKLVESIVKITPFRRIAESSEVADAVAFFCSQDANFITGQVLSVSGGLTMVD